MEFMCCLNMDFTWKSLTRAEVCLYDIMRKMLRPAVSIFCVCLLTNLAEMTSLILQADTILYNEIQRKKYNYFHYFSAFSVQFETGIR